MASIFISYRRSDSGAIARRLADTLAQMYGPGEVFIDTDAIRASQNWQTKINEALKEAMVVIPVIGLQWLFIQDEDGRRRIDLEDDWVRNEILFALKNNKKLLPVLVSSATRPAEKALPDVLKPLFPIQTYDLKEEYWQRDTNDLIQIIGSLGIRSPHQEQVPLPPPIDTSKELTAEEQKEALKTLPDWNIQSRRGIHKNIEASIELHRVFKFQSFEDAMHFMATASRYIGKTNHHPDWHNLWVSVEVWLTTWDIGHRVTFKDVRLAEYLEKLYRDYALT